MEDSPHARANLANLCLATKVSTVLISMESDLSCAKKNVYNVSATIDWILFIHDG